MTKAPRITPETLAVLEAIASAGELAGAQISRTASLSTGTLYPILQRLERAGWLTSRWEEVDPREAGRPRRRYYQMTGLGQAQARAAAKSMHGMIGRLAFG